MNLKLLLVTWKDSRRDMHDNAVDDKEFESFPLAIIESIGWGRVLKDKVVLAVEHYPRIEGMQSEQVRGLYSFPRTCVVNIQELKKKGDKKSV